MKTTLTAPILLLALLLGVGLFQPLAVVRANRAAQPRLLVLAGGTLIDVSDFGKSEADIKDAVVVIQDGQIVAAGPRSKVKIPAHAQIINASGKYIVPGLIDGFAAMSNQAQANAYLYMGVTSIVSNIGAQDRRRLPLFLNAKPSPRIYKLASIGYARDKDGKPRQFSEAETMKQLESLAQDGVKVLLVHYPITPERTRQIVRRAHELGLVTIGELGFTSYHEAVEAGVDSFVHSSRYSMEIAPPEMRIAVAGSPFGQPRYDYYKFLTLLNPEDSKLKQYAAFLASSPAALIPTLSLEYLDLPDHDNPWKEPVAAILDPKDIHLPANPLTGNRDSQTENLADAFPPGMAQTIMGIEERYRRAGAKYLTGSGTSAFGTMPGISLHTELQLLIRIGVPPRQALAASTGNFGEIYRWKKVGQVKAGYNADLLVLNENPVKDISNLKKIRLVILNGEILDREKLLAKQYSQP